MTAPFFTEGIFFRRSGPGGVGFAGACRRDNSSANISPAPAHRDPVGNSGISPIGGASLLENLVSTARRRGVPFTRVKGTKTRLGRCPKTPVAGCAGYGLISGGSRKSIRTAHRIAPKVATGVSALSPHPLSRWRERGPDGRASAGRQSIARGVRACKNRKPLTHGYG